MPNTEDSIKNYVDNIASHLEIAAHLSMQMQQLVADSEGDSDLYRKLSYYLVPNMIHWVNGAQAGNMKDLRELLERRAKNAETMPQTPGKQGNGSEVLTDKK